MLVFVRSPSGAIWELQLAASAAVEQVKQHISKLTPLPPWKQDIWHNTTRLEDDRTLADYGVAAESTLRLSQRVDRQREEEMNRCMPIMMHVCATLQLHEDFAVELYLFGFSSDTSIPFMCDAEPVRAFAASPRSQDRCDKDDELMIFAGGKNICSSCRAPLGKSSHFFPAAVLFIL
jgi:hypothetical protein